MNSLSAYIAARQVSPILSGPAVVIVLSARGSPDSVTGIASVAASVANQQKSVLSAQHRKEE